MGFNCGIVGLPNVGKSTLFNALTQTAAAEAANYPFCTIEPNVGRVGVLDDRLEQLAAIAKSQKIIPTQLEIVDIAGLVRGASKGEGLGNQFLGHIRSTDAIIHVLRCFESDDITHVDGNIDPLRDLTTIETELMLADIESLERRKANKKVKPDPRIDLCIETLNKGEVPKDVDDLQLLSTKPFLYVCNVSEDEILQGNDHSKRVFNYAAQKNRPCVLVSASIESEIAQLSSQEEKQEFLHTLGLKESGLQCIAKEGYGLLGLITFFTIGPKEARAWTLQKGLKAPQAAGVIHTDFEKGFICAETIAYEDYIACEGETKAKAAGKLRLEGRDYLVQDGDVFHFRFNV
jgi:GTP-binding protein YchF